MAILEKVDKLHRATAWQGDFQITNRYTAGVAWMIGLSHGIPEAIISVIVVVHDSAEALRRSLPALVAQLEPEGADIEGECHILCAVAGIEDDFVQIRDHLAQPLLAEELDPLAGRVRHQQRRRYVDRRVRDEPGVLDLPLWVIEAL